MRYVLLALALTGCTDMTLAQRQDKVTITWVDRHCGRSAGCAIPMGDKCYIAAPKEDLDVLAHELLHCIGAEHSN